MFDGEKGRICYEEGGSGNDLLDNSCEVGVDGDEGLHFFSGWSDGIMAVFGKKKNGLPPLAIV